MKEDNTFRKVTSFLKKMIEHRDVGLMVTSSATGKPHATWMGTVGYRDLSTIITMTASATRKVKNIEENPNVEWVFTDDVNEIVVYLRGTAKIIKDATEIKNEMKDLYGMTKAYFLNYLVGNSTFVVLETRVEEIEYSVPSKNLYETIVMSAESIS